MKYLMLGVVCCALAVSGCRYSKNADDLANAGDDTSIAVGGDEDATIGEDIDVVMVDEANADGDGDIAPATAVPFDQDPNYALVPDAIFAPVYFAFDANSLIQSELAKIETVANHLNANADQVVIVEGNCDERGSNEYNLSLGQLRAGSIQEYLIALGIAPSRIQTKSYGEEKPAVAGAGEEVWKLNRRGEFGIYRKK